MAMQNEVIVKAALYCAQDASARMCDDAQSMWTAYFDFVERGKVPKNDIWEKWQRYYKIAERNIERLRAQAKVVRKWREELCQQ